MKTSEIKATQVAAYLTNGNKAEMGIILILAIASLSIQCIALLLGHPLCKRNSPKEIHDMLQNPTYFELLIMKRQINRAIRTNPVLLPYKTKLFGAILAVSSASSIDDISALLKEASNENG